MKYLIKYLSIFSLSFAILSCGGDDDDPNPLPTAKPTDPPVEVTTITDVAVSNDNLKTLVTALQATGLDKTLDDASAEFTVFAPTDDAFMLLGDELTRLLDNPDELKQVLLYHVVAGSKIDAAAATAAVGTKLVTANDAGSELAVSSNPDGLLLNFSLVVTADVMADNGIIHVIDAVLVPPPALNSSDKNIIEIASSDDRFETLTAAIRAAGLVDALSAPLGDEMPGLTVFAPTDTAFSALGGATIDRLLANPEVLAEILKQHVVSGQVNSVTALTLNGKNAETLSGAEFPVALTDDRKLTFGGADIIIKDIPASNGIIHVIDMVIVGDVQVPDARTIVDVAIADGNFDTLVELVTLADLGGLLSDTNKKFTVFAPTDVAFAKLDPDLVTALKNDKALLTDVLTYHVIAGSEIMSDAAINVAKSDMSLVDVANTDQVALSFDEESLFVNLSKVVTANVPADNGVIHVIDSVLIPPADGDAPTMNIVETAIADDRFETLVAAVTAADLVDTLSDETKKFTVFAPTDEAFAMLPEGVLNALLADTAALTSILTQHVVGAEVDALTAFTLNGSEAETLSGAKLAVKIVDGVLTIGGANVIITDVKTTNGIIHVIDSVIVGDVDVPKPSVVDVANARGNFTTLLSLLEAADLVGLLTDMSKEFTVFGPNDAAFAKLDEATTTFLTDPANVETLKDVLTYHVLGSKVPASAALGLAASDMNTVDTANMDKVALSISGTGDEASLFVNTSKVVDTDIMASNVVLHEIDTVLIPPEEHGAPTMNIVEIAQSMSGTFSTLVDAVVAADLVALLSDTNKTFTVFAPTNDAFAKIPAADLADLLKPENKATLTDILTQHVIADLAVDSVTAYSLNGKKVATASGKEVLIEVGSGYLKVQGSKVIATDVPATNGVIHVIDTVITTATVPATE